MRNFLLFISFLFIIGCINSSFKEETIDLKGYLKDIHHIEFPEKGMIFIIPMNICHYCTNNTIKKIITLNNKKDIKIILTDYAKLTLKEPSEKLSGFKVYIDPKMTITKRVRFFNGEYPVIVSINNNAIQEIKLTRLAVKKLKRV